MKATVKSYAKVRSLAAVTVMLSTLAASGAATAQAAGTWLLEAGFSRMMPKSANGSLSAPGTPDTRIDFDRADALAIAGTYMFTDNVSAQLFFPTPYEHRLRGKGAIAALGRIGSVEQIAPTLLAQFRFLDANAAFRPYVGLGVTRAMFREEVGSAAMNAFTNPGSITGFQVDSAWGWTAQLGGTYAINEKWFAGLDVKKTVVETTVRFSTGQKLDTRLDPLSVNISIGYRF